MIIYIAAALSKRLEGDFMTINLYNTSSAPNALTKALSAPSVHDGAVRGEINVVRPVVDIVGNIHGYNYAEIPDFDNRKYFIEEMKIVRDGITRVSLKCDVLGSFHDDIIALPAIAKRVGTETDYLLYSPYIPDPRQSFSAFHTTRAFTLGDLDGYALAAPYIIATVST